MIKYIRDRFHPLWRLRKMPWYRTCQNKMDFIVSKKCGYITFFIMFLRDLSLFIISNDLEKKTHKIFENILLQLPILHLFDIGSNVGTFSWHALNIKPELQVFLFEPDTVNINLLKKTIKFNSLTKVTIYEGVVSDKIGKIDFFNDRISGATGSIRDDTANASSLHKAYGMGNKVLVSSTCLNAYIDMVYSSTTSTLLKIDVEGAEADVFNGAMLFINKIRPVIIVECFDEKNLILVLQSDYISYPLAENNNYILFPKEIDQKFIEKKILTFQN